MPKESTRSMQRLQIRGRSTGNASERVFSAHQDYSMLQAKDIVEMPAEKKVADNGQCFYRSTVAGLDTYELANEVKTNVGGAHIDDCSNHH